MHYDSKVGHIGGNLSCIDFLMVLHHKIMQSEDSFILSKGHAAGALYATLWSLGKLAEEDLNTFHRDNTRLAGHPISKSIPGCNFSTGSLGHGIGIAAGIALARKLKNQNNRVYCLTSDGEWQEGSTWESLHFITSKNLENITVIVDLNGLQGFGATKDVMPLPSLVQRLACFDIEILECAGHDLECIENVLLQKHSRPQVIILNTVKGKGISFMENKLEWHYLPLSEEQYVQAYKELSAL